MMISGLSKTFCGGRAIEKKWITNSQWPLQSHKGLQTEEEEEDAVNRSRDVTPYTLWERGFLLYNVTEFYPRYVYPNMSQTSGIICPLS
jgi:hypothetical protein